MKFKQLTYKNYTQAKNSVPFTYLGSTTNSSKTAKGEKFDITTYIVYWAASNESGYQVCPKASKECRESCIFKTGLTKVEDYAGKTVIRDARIARTRLFFENRAFYMQMLIAEITTARNAAQKKGNIFAVRLNGTSDIIWENITYMGLTIFEIFPDVTFYDYTKIPNRNISAIPNYSLTFSYTGRNTLDCLNVLDNNGNVAIVFSTKRNKQLPDVWKNYSIIDGDLTDYRPNDMKGAIVGLRFKETANKASNEDTLNSIFVIDENSLDCAYTNESNRIALSF